MRPEFCSLILALAAMSGAAPTPPTEQADASLASRSWPESNDERDTTPSQPPPFVFKRNAAKYWEEKEEEKPFY
ncbi:hypothetical protein RJ55_05634 [Drechmeria coniospora]|nr:hypothetical protein RJ55_05634 [Drechmeria coniospora]